MTAAPNIASALPASNAGVAASRAALDAMPADLSGLFATLLGKQIAEQAPDPANVQPGTLDADQTPSTQMNALARPAISATTEAASPPVMPGTNGIYPPPATRFPAPPASGAPAAMLDPGRFARFSAPLGATEPEAVRDGPNTTTRGIPADQPVAALNADDATRGRDVQPGMVDVDQSLLVQLNTLLMPMRPEATDTPPGPDPVDDNKAAKNAPDAVALTIEQIQQAVANPVAAVEQNQQAVAKLVEQSERAVAKPVAQNQQAVAKPVGQSRQVIAKPVEQNQQVVAKLFEQNEQAVAKPVGQNRQVVAKPVERNQQVDAKLFEQNEQAVAKLVERNEQVVAKLFEQNEQAVAKPIAQNEQAVAKPVAQNQQTVAKLFEQNERAVAKPVAQNQQAVAKLFEQNEPSVAKPVAQNQQAVARQVTAFGARQLNALSKVAVAGVAPQAADRLPVEVNGRASIVPGPGVAPAVPARQPVVKAGVASGKERDAKRAPPAEDIGKQLETLRRAASDVKHQAAPTQAATVAKALQVPAASANPQAGNEQQANGERHQPHNSTPQLSDVAKPDTFPQPAAPAYPAQIAHAQDIQPAMPGADAAPAQTAQAGAQPVSVSLHIAPQAEAAPLPNPGSLAVTIATKTKNGEKHFDIRLDPPELGRVDVKLSIDDSGKTQANLTVEKPHTLDPLQRDRSTLERALRDAGLDLAGNSLSFSLKGQDRERSDTPSSRGRAHSVSAVAQTDSSLPIPGARLMAVDGRLDIRV